MRISDITVGLADNSTIRITPGEIHVTGTQRVTPDAMSYDGCVCHNLVAGDVGGAPGLVSRDPEPAAGGTRRDIMRLGDAVIFIDGNTLGIESGDGTVSTLMAVAGVPCAAVTEGDDAVIHFSDGRVLRVTAGEDGAYVAVDETDPQYGGIQLVAAAVSSFEVTTPLFALDTAAHAADGLPADALETLTKELGGAFSGAVARAVRAGYYAGPALMRYRLLDAAAQTLYTSPLRLVAAPSGFQGRSAIPVSGASGDGRYRASAAVECYRPAIVVPPADDSVAARRVAYIAVDTTPPLFVIDPQGRVSVTVAQNGNNLTLTARLAGAEVRDAAAVMLRSALEHAGTLLSQVALLMSPYSGALGAPGTLCHIGVPSSAPLADLIRSVRRTLSLPVVARDEARQTDMLAAPHLFSAGLAYADDDMVVWAAPTVRRGRPATLHELLPRLSDTGMPEGRWQAYVAVTMDDGDCVVRACEGTGTAPVGVSGVVTYPSPHARSMTVCVTQNGVTRRRTLALTPCAAAGMAYHIEGDGTECAIDGEVEYFGVPAHRSRGSRHAAMLMTADARRCREILAVKQLPAGAVRGIVGGMRTTAASDRTRLSCRVIADDGVYVLTYGADGRIRGLRKVSREQLTHWTLDDTGTLYGATADGGLTAITERSGRRQPLRPGPVTALSYDPVLRRLLIDVDRSEADNDDASDEAVGASENSSAKIRIEYDPETGQLRTCTPADPTHIRYAIPIHLPHRALRPLWIALDLATTAGTDASACSDVSACMDEPSARAQGTAQGTTPALRIKVTGEPVVGGAPRLIVSETHPAPVTAPIILPLPAPPCRRLHLTITT